MTQGRNGRSLARGQVASQVGTSRPGPPPRAAAAWDQVSLCRATLPGVSPGYQDAFRISTFRPNTEKGPWVRKGILRRISFRGGRDFTGLFQSGENEILAEETILLLFFKTNDATMTVRERWKRVSTEGEPAHVFASCLHSYV
ncbi:uncharacterized protein [Equus caballus]|uniref:uncharacterized protein isoform X3 n=1 Tax=Equus caballus TaxID=9796 RepID=UPI0038B3D584